MVMLEEGVKLLTNIGRQKARTKNAVK